MIDAGKAIEILKLEGLNFFAGVPDSLLKPFCDALKESNKRQVTTANEGNALALAAGYYLSIGGIPVVYMQNSGLGNIVNPLLSLTDEKVYNIPTLFIIGYRGEAGVKDEPQHITQGRLTEELCACLGLSASVLSKEDTEESFSVHIKKAADYMKESGKPYALIIRKGTFSGGAEEEESESELPLRREILSKLLEVLPKDSCIISTTGKTSRELFELRGERGEGHEKDFLTVGSMGHASSVALGIAMNTKDLNVICIDGEGALMMHMGAMPVIGQTETDGFVHIVINNGAHDSVGGQDNVGGAIDFSEIALSCGYKTAKRVGSLEEIPAALKECLISDGASFLQIGSRKGADPALGRPDRSPAENKEEFMKYIETFRGPAARENYPSGRKV